MPYPKTSGQPRIADRLEARKPETSCLLCTEQLITSWLLCTQLSWLLCTQLCWLLCNQEARNIMPCGCPCFQISCDWADQNWVDLDFSLSKSETNMLVLVYHLLCCQFRLGTLQKSKGGVERTDPYMPHCNAAASTCLCLPSAISNWAQLLQCKNHNQRGIERSDLK